MKNLLFLFTVLNCHLILQAMDPPVETPDLDFVIMAEQGDLDAQKMLFNFYSSGSNPNINKSMDLGKQIINNYASTNRDILDVLSELADVFFKQKDYENAAKYNYLTLQKIKSYDGALNPAYIHGIYIKIAHIEFLLKTNIKQALSYCAQLLNEPSLSVEQQEEIKFLLAEYLRKQGGAANLKQAIAYQTEILALQKDPNSLHVAEIKNAIGFYYECSGFFAEAAVFYEIGCASEIGFSYCNLANLYENGLGVEQDSHKAQELFAKGSKSKLAWENARKDMYKEASDELDQAYKEFFEQVKAPQGSKRKAETDIGPAHPKRQLMGENRGLLTLFQVVKRKLDSGHPSPWQRVYPILKKALSSDDEKTKEEASRLCDFYFKALDMLLSSLGNQSDTSVLEKALAALDEARFSGIEKLRDWARFLLKKHYKLADKCQFDPICMYCCLELKNCGCTEQDEFIRNIGSLCFVCMSADNKCTCQAELLFKLMKALFPGESAPQKTTEPNQNCT